MMLDEHRFSTVYGAKEGSSPIYIHKQRTSINGINAYISNDSVSNIVKFADVVDYCQV